MALYPIALFLHITGALGLFSALALEWTALAGLRRARTAEQAREWAGIYRVLQRIGPASVALLLVFGLYMTAVSWGLTGWIGIGLLSLISLAVLGAISWTRIGPAIGRAVSRPGPLPPEARAQLDRIVFVASLRARTALALAVVVLMTAKPDLIVSLTIVAVAVGAGLASAMAHRTREPARGEAA